MKLLYEGANFEKKRSAYLWRRLRPVGVPMGPFELGLAFLGRWIGVPRAAFEILWILGELDWRTYGGV